jgi:hypothetical protein
MRYRAFLLADTFDFLSLLLTTVVKQQTTIHEEKGKSLRQIQAKEK